MGVVVIFSLTAQQQSGTQPTQPKNVFPHVYLYIHTIHALRIFGIDCSTGLLSLAWKCRTRRNIACLLAYPYWNGGIKKLCCGRTHDSGVQRVAESRLMCQRHSLRMMMRHDPVQLAGQRPSRDGRNRQQLRPWSFP